MASARKNCSLLYPLRNISLKRRQLLFSSQLHVNVLHVIIKKITCQLLIIFFLKFLQKVKFQTLVDPTAIINSFKGLYFQHASWFMH